MYHIDIKYTPQGMVMVTAYFINILHGKLTVGRCLLRVLRDLRLKRASRRGVCRHAVSSNQSCQQHASIFDGKTQVCKTEKHRIFIPVSLYIPLIL